MEFPPNWAPYRWRLPSFLFSLLAADCRPQYYRFIVSQGTLLLVIESHDNEYVCNNHIHSHPLDPHHEYIIYLKPRSTGSKHSFWQTLSVYTVVVLYLHSNTQQPVCVCMWYVLYTTWTIGSCSVTSCYRRASWYSLHFLLML